MHDGAVIVVSVTAFEPEPMAALLVLNDGDAVSISGPLTLGTWTDNEGQARPSAAMLNWLESNGFIRRYTAQGKKCILVLEFVKHQNPHKNEAESELPAPLDECTKPEEIGTTTEIIGSTRADSLSSDSLIPDSLTPSNEGVARTLQAEACITAELIEAAMRAAAHWKDDPEEWRRQCLEVPPHQRIDLLDHLQREYPKR